MCLKCDLVDHITDFSFALTVTKMRENTNSPPFPLYVKGICKIASVDWNYYSIPFNGL